MTTAPHSAMLGRTTMWVASTSRVTAMLAVVFGVLYVVAAALPAPPGHGASGAEVVKYFGDHADAVRVRALLLTIGLMVLAFVLGLLRSAIDRGLRDVFLLAGGAFVAQTAVATWIELGLASPQGRSDPGAVAVLFSIRDYYGPVLNGTTAALVLPMAITSLRPGSHMPRWVGIACLVTVAEQTVETVTIFGRHGFIAPGGTMNDAVGGALVGLSLLSFAIAVAKRRGRATAASSDTGRPARMIR